MPDTVQRETAQQSFAAIPHHSVDSPDLPQWGKADDGRFVRLVDDTHLQIEFAAWRSEACNHPQQFTGKTINAAAVEVFKRYCRTCGIATTQQLPHRTIEGTIVTLIDEDKRQKLINKYVKYRREGFDALTSRAANRLQPERRAEYADYLGSSEWRARRTAVMDRCDGLCEGCRQQNADDVHHLTYKHIGNEFLFELAAMCRDCHTRWHEDQA